MKVKNCFIQLIDGIKNDRSWEKPLKASAPLFEDSVRQGQKITLLSSSKSEIL